MTTFDGYSSEFLRLLLLVRMANIKCESQNVHCQKNSFSEHFSHEFPLAALAFSLLRKFLFSDIEVKNACK